jgi:hypothetical protein
MMKGKKPHDGKERRKKERKKEIEDIMICIAWNWALGFLSLLLFAVALAVDLGYMDGIKG